MTINFDMDGTLVDLYGVPNWEESLKNADVSPYVNAKPLVSMSTFARYVHLAQSYGIKVNIITWLSKNSTEEYDRKVCTAKRVWLKEHLPSVVFDNIYILDYGTPKGSYGRHGILFDDELANRVSWADSSQTNIPLTEKDLLTKFYKIIKGVSSK